MRSLHFLPKHQQRVVYLLGPALNAFVNNNTNINAQ
jgi:hypothetical protein